MFTPFAFRTIQFEPVSTATLDIEYLVVAGGGAGGAGYGGGGGAGGFRTGSLTLNNNTLYSVVVGGGGPSAGANNYNNQSQDGGNSVLSTITSAGGGAGAYSSFTTINVGRNGGSGGGGGAARQAINSGSGNIPSTSPSQGSNGGYGGTKATNGAGGGGGGALTVGGNGPDANNQRAGVGGSGSQWLDGNWYAGGGGGGSYLFNGFATGGLGGGGNGGGNNGAILPTSGLRNTGGGGGGAPGAGSLLAGAPGGSGIVIVRYVGNPVLEGGLVNTSGGYTTHTFVSSSNLTFGTPTTPSFPTTNLLFRLEGALTSSYPGTGGTWFDISGNNRNFGMVNSPTFSTDKFNFNGTNQYFTSSYNPALTNFTAHVVFKAPSNVAGYRRLIEKDSVNGFWMGQSGFSNNYSGSWGGGVRATVSPFGVFHPLTNFNQLSVLSLQRSGSIQNTYLNGEFVVSQTVSATATNTGLFRIGADYVPNATSIFTGSIAAVSCFDTAQSEQTIKDIYAFYAQTYNID